MEKEILFFDELAFGERQRIYMANLETLRKIGALFASLGLGQIDRITLDQIMAKRFETIEEHLQQALKKSFKGKLNPVMAEAFDDLASKRISEFQEKAMVLVSKFERNKGRPPFHIPTPLNRYELIDGVFSIPDSTWNLIREECSSIIETEEQRSLYEQLQKACEALTTFWANLGSNFKDKASQLNVFDLIDYDETSFFPSKYNDYQQLVK